MGGEVDLQQGDRLVVVVGQRGWDNSAGGNWGGGGGGATFVGKIVRPGNGAKMKKFVFFVSAIAVAGGGAGLDSRKIEGQALGGVVSTSGQEHGRAAGGNSGGGGGSSCSDAIQWCRSLSFMF